MLGIEWNPPHPMESPLPFHSFEKFLPQQKKTLLKVESFIMHPAPVQIAAKAQIIVVLEKIVTLQVMIWLHE